MKYRRFEVRSSLRSSTVRAPTTRHDSIESRSHPWDSIPKHVLGSSVWNYMGIPLVPDRQSSVMSLDPLHTVELFRAWG